MSNNFILLRACELVPKKYWSKTVEFLTRASNCAEAARRSLPLGWDHYDVTDLDLATIHIAR